MVVRDVRTHEPDEMPLAEDNDVLEQLSATTQDPAFGSSILPRAPVRDTNGFDAERPDALDDGRAEDGVTVEDEIPRCSIVGESLAQLLHHPRCRRIECGVEMHDVATAVLDDKETVQEPE